MIGSGLKKTMAFFLSLSMFLTGTGPLTAQAETMQAVDEEVPTLTIQMNEGGRSLKHGAAGWLYGLGDEGVPSTSLITPLKANTAVQKAPNGMQHPNGDVLDTARTFLNAGGKNIQIYVPDYYALWGYEFTGPEEYMKILEMQAQACIDAGIAEDVSYVLYNEPSNNWVGTYHDEDGNEVTGWYSMYWFWKDMVDLLRDVYKRNGIPSSPKTVGLNLSSYQWDTWSLPDGHKDDYSVMETYIEFCVEHDCMPDIISWHDLSTSQFNNFEKEYHHYRALEKQYGLEEREIVINEYADFYECSSPGNLARWIGLWEEFQVSGCLPFWHLSNNLNSLAADTNEGNGGWWLYKWYGDMSGDYLPVETSNAQKADFYGAASVDENKKCANVLFGGKSGKANIVLSDILDTDTFADAKKVHVKVEATEYTGFHGAADEPRIVKEGALQVQDGQVLVPMDHMNALSGYLITVTQASEDERTGLMDQTWKQVYEAEDGTRTGGAWENKGGSFTPCSGERKMVISGIRTSEDSITMTVEVPEDGYYKYEMIYGAGDGVNTKNPEKHHPYTAVNTLSLDGTVKEEMVLPTTLGDQMTGMYTTYLKMDKGTHTLTIAGTDSKSSSAVDCIYLSYMGEKEEDTKFRKTYEAELGDFNMLSGTSDTKLTTVKEGTVSYVDGLEKRSVTEGGGLRFTVVVPENGMYRVGLRYQADENALARLYIDNDTVHLDNVRTTYLLDAVQGEWKESYKTVFFQKGVNIVDIDAEGAVKLDSMSVSLKEDSKPVAVVEAEDCLLSGEAVIGEDGDNKNQASGYGYVSGIKASNGVELIPQDAPEFTVQGLGRVVDLGEPVDKNNLKLEVYAPESGNYKLVVWQSNGELFGKHDYNYQMVERYASFRVNDGPAQKVVFRNTYSDERFKPHVVDIALEKGNNVITIYNDNSKVNTNGVLKAGKTEHRPENIDYGVLTNYTPNFDKFELYESQSDYVPGNQEEPEEPKPPRPSQTKKDIQKLTLSSITGKKATGKEIAPKVVLKDGAEVLKEGTDYLLSYENNKDPGTAFVVITGTGNYTGVLRASFDIYAAKGKTYQVGQYQYRVLKDALGKGTVSITGAVKKGIKKAVIPKAVRIGNHSYKVTQVAAGAFKGMKKLNSVTIGTNVRMIRAEAFKGAKQLKRVKILSKNITQVGREAFVGIHKKAKVKVPPAKLRAYKKLLKNRVPKSAGIVK